MTSKQIDFAMAVYLNFHKAIRHHFGNFVAQVARTTWRNEKEVELLQNKLDYYWEMVEHHHQSEDHGLFPMLAEVDPEFATAFTGLMSDHQAIDRLVGQVKENLLLVLEYPRRGMPEVYWQEFCTTTKTLEELMAAHLEREEAAVIPVIGWNFTVEQQIVMEAGIINRMGLDYLSKIIPWIHEVLNEKEKREAYSRLPREIKPYYHLFQKEYLPQLIPMNEFGTAA